MFEYEIQSIPEDGLEMVGMMRLCDPEFLGIEIPDKKHTMFRPSISGKHIARLDVHKIATLRRKAAARKHHR